MRRSAGGTPLTLDDVLNNLRVSLDRITREAQEAGMTQEEIAAKLGIKYRTLRSIMHSYRTEDDGAQA